MERFNLRHKFSFKVIKLNIFTKILLTIAFLYLLLRLFTATIHPTFLAVSEIKAKSLAMTIASNAINMKTKDIKYENLITLQKDKTDKVTALNANVIEMNKIKCEVAEEIQHELNDISGTTVRIPIGNIIGNDLLSSLGPVITIKIIPGGSVDTDFMTEFVTSGINQTRHRIYLKVTTYVKILSPLNSKTVSVINKILVAETVIVGEVPQTYNNIEGIKNVDPLKTIDLAP